MRNCLYIFLVFILMFVSNSVRSQKVGLVLSGGGAKGIAHIGVIKALEENNIPIDYIAGTSIGAIVGGLYSCGYSPEKIKEILREKKFQDYSKGLIPEKSKYYFKLENKDASNARVHFNLDRDGNPPIVLPTNLISTQPMDFGILEYFSEFTALSKENFDSLFVPFRCVASDMYNGCEKVFHKGDLGLAVRASMTFPFYFKPVEIDSVLYFDGGIFNNFPVDVMEKEFNPDFIIGVSVTSNMKKPNPDDLLLQLESLIVRNDKIFDVPPEKGIAIKINFNDIRLLDFDKIDIIHDVGYAAADKFIDSIKTRIQKRESHNSLEKKRKTFKAKRPHLIFDKINILGLSPNEEFYANSILNKGPLNIVQLENEYYKLISDCQFETAFPFAKYNDSTGYFDLSFKMKKERRLKAHIGACIASSSKNQFFIGASYKYLNKFSFLFRSNLYLGQVYSSFTLGGKIDFPLSVPLSLDLSGNINRFDFFKGNSRLFTLDAKPPYIINWDNNFRADLSTPLNRTATIRLGFASGQQAYKYFQISNFKKTDTADITRFNSSSIHLSIFRNTHNFVQYPNKGSNNFISVRYVLGKEYNFPGSTTALSHETQRYLSWMQIHLYYDNYLKTSKYLTFGFMSELFISNKPNFVNYFSSILSAPSFTPMTYNKTSFLIDYYSRSYAAIGIKPIITFTSRFNLRLEAYLFAPYKKMLKEEMVKRIYTVREGEAYAKKYFLFGASLVYNSNIGPIAFSVNYFPDEKVATNSSVKTHFMFHMGYILFNKKTFDH